MPDNTALKAAVEALPEIYQPIYGHKELYDGSSRSCEDRLIHIRPICEAVSKKQQRKIRVLDLGCAQGYMSFSLAALDCVSDVTGVDYLDKNVDVCKLISAERADGKTSFVCSAIEDFIAAIGDAYYDVVLGLSVFHHLCNIHGWEAVQGIIAKLAKHTACAIFELAQKAEPLFWAEKLPEYDCDVLKGFSFINQLAKFPTHLSEVTRPLYYTSSEYLYFAPSDMLKIDEVIYKGHEFSPDEYLACRRYYKAEGMFVKTAILGLDGNAAMYSAHAKNEIEQEAEFLKKMNGEAGFPQLAAFGESDNLVWLMRKYIDGVLLSEKLPSMSDDEKMAAVKQCIGMLVKLEEKGLYFNDFRTWNILSTQSGLEIIDYAISESPADVAWPFNPVLSCIIFINDAMTGDVRVTPVRSIVFTRCLLKFFSAQQLNAVENIEISGHMLADLYKVLFESTAAPQPETVATQRSAQLERVFDESITHIDILLKHDGTVSSEFEKLSNAFGELSKNVDASLTSLGEAVNKQPDGNKAMAEELQRLAASLSELSQNANESLISLNNENKALRAQLKVQEQATQTQNAQLAKQLAELHAELVNTNNEILRMQQSGIWRAYNKIKGNK